jgi:hypothetical protein
VVEERVARFEPAFHAALEVDDIAIAHILYEVNPIPHIASVYDVIDTSGCLSFAMRGMATSFIVGYALIAADGVLKAA